MSTSSARYSRRGPRPAHAGAPSGSWFGDLKHPKSIRVPTKVPVPKSTHTHAMAYPRGTSTGCASAAGSGPRLGGRRTERRRIRRRKLVAKIAASKHRDCSSELWKSPEKHLWQKEQTMQRCPRSSSLLARMRYLRARPQMRISSGSSHVNLAHDCWRAMPARRLPHQQLERVAPQAARCGSAAAARERGRTI